MTAVTDRLSWRQWVGFMAMVLGMFMAILDIQIVSASISDIQAGLAASPDEASWVQTSYLIAEIVMIPLSGWLSRLLSTRVLFVASALGFTLFSLRLRRRLQPGRDGGVPRRSGLHRRGDDTDRVRHDLPAVPRREAEPDVGADRPDRHNGADHRSDTRRLAHRSVLVALAVPDQRPGRADRGRRGVDLPRHRQTRLVAATQLRPDRPDPDGAVPGCAGIRAGGRRSLGLVPGRDHRLVRRDFRGRCRAVLLAHADAARSARGAARVRQRQLRVRLAVQLRARHWAVWLGVSGAAVPRPRARLRQPADRRDDVRDRRCDVPVGADRGAACARPGSARDAGNRAADVRRRPVVDGGAHRRLRRSGSCSARRRCAAPR